MPPPTAYPVPLRVHDLVRTDHGDRAVRRAASQGTFTRVGVGAYLDSARWRSLDRREQYLLRVHTQLHRLRPSIVASHWSAAAVWGMPAADGWPNRVEVIDVRRTTSNRSGALLRRPGPLPDGDTASWREIRVTTPARTAVDLALTQPFAVAVMAFDHGLRTAAFTKDELRAQLERRPRARRATSADRALDFSTPSAQWPGESFSRVAMAARGLVSPILQHGFFDSNGTIGVVDFWWPDSGVVGEFDGVWKYTDPRFTNGQTPVEVLRTEKRRQNRLELHPEVHRVVRWDYAIARDPDRLAELLLAAGVRRARSRVPS